MSQRRPHFSQVHSSPYRRSRFSPHLQVTAIGGPRSTAAGLLVADALALRAVLALPGGDQRHEARY